MKIDEYDPTPTIARSVLPLPLPGLHAALSPYLTLHPPPRYSAQRSPPSPIVFHAALSDTPPRYSAQRSLASIVGNLARASSIAAECSWSVGSAGQLLIMANRRDTAQALVLPKKRNGHGRGTARNGTERG